jgi:outer membrane protein assembly factor BamB
MAGVRLERTDSVLGTCSIQCTGRGDLVVLDGSGKDIFTANPDAENQRGMQPIFATYGVTRGNLLVVSYGKQMVAYNTLATPDGLSPPVLWRATVGSNLEMNAEYGPSPENSTLRRAGSYRAPRWLEDGKWIGIIGPVTSRGIVFQDQRRLVCVDPISGEARWSRTDVPQGCDLFGDDEYVFAVPTDSTQARIYSMIDGRQVGTTKVPVWREQLVTRGREIISWRAGEDRRWELASMDAKTGHVGWRRDFAATPAVDIEQGRYVSVVEPRGRIQIIDAADGQVLVDYPAPNKPTIEELHLLVSRDNFTLIVKHPKPGNVRQRVAMYNTPDSIQVDGEVYVFDRTTGKMRWNRPADVVQQSLLLSQPADLPFVLFAGVFQQQDAGGSQPRTSLLMLDKASGRTLFSQDDLPQAGGGQCLARTDAASHQATVEMAGRTILLQFTDQRRPPEPPAMSEVESAGSKTNGGLMGILRGALGGS